MNNLSIHAIMALSRGYEIQRIYKHGYFMPEHLLLGMLTGAPHCNVINPQMGKCFYGIFQKTPGPCKVLPLGMRTLLGEKRRQNVCHAIPPGTVEGIMRELRRFLHKVEKDDERVKEIQKLELMAQAGTPTPVSRRQEKIFAKCAKTTAAADTVMVFWSAKVRARRRQVDVRSLFSGFYALSADESFARHILERHNVTVECFKRVSSSYRLISRRSPSRKKSNTSLTSYSAEEWESEGSAAPRFENFAVNLNEKARQKKIDPAIGREREILKLIQALGRKRKSNALLVGPPGCGKTAIMEGLAYKIVHNDVPDVIKGKTIYALDMGSLVAGTQYRGQFEERLKAVVSRAVSSPDILLFIDEIHTVTGAGAASGNALDASNIMKPALASGELKCVGATTHEEYRTHLQKDKAFTRRFKKIDIEEPTNEETVGILKRLLPLYEAHHNVKYADECAHAAVNLSGKYMRDKAQPDKAIDLIDDAGAKNNALGKNRKTIITGDDIAETAAETANIPPAKISGDESLAMKTLESRLSEAVFGQDEAVRRVCRTIKVARAGMRGEERPLAQFCFLGQTGCGKTELAKQLAKTLEMTLTRFDMSEYSSKETVSKFIGASPGYVGFENAGQLTEAVIRSPNSVILLDEIEKADPVVFNLLLQVMDYGTLTDNQGRKADFRSAVIIMTGNIGGHTLSSSKGRLGFGEESLCRKSTVEEEAAKFFSPEFRARLDGVIVFNPINSALMRKITEKHLRGWLESPSFKRKNISVHISEKAKDYIAAKGYDAKLGARPVTRVINEEIQAPLADEILFGKLSKGGTVTVDETGGRLDIEVRAANPAVKTSAD